MSNEKRTGLGSVPAGLLRPTTRPDAKDKEKASAVEESVEETSVTETSETPEKQPEPAVSQSSSSSSSSSSTRSTRGSRKRKTAAESERVVPWKIYLPESIHFRLRQLAYEKGLKLSEAAAEVLDRGLPFYEIVKKDRAG